MNKKIIIALLIPSIFLFSFNSYAKSEDYDYNELVRLCKAYSILVENSTENAVNNGEIDNTILTYDKFDCLVQRPNNTDLFYRTYINHKSEVVISIDDIAIWVWSSEPIFLFRSGGSFNSSTLTADSVTLCRDISSGSWQNMKQSNGLYKTLVPSAMENSFNYYIGYHNFKLFNSHDSAQNYLLTGSLNGLIDNGTENYSNSLKFENVNFSYYSANSFNDCYININYTIPKEFNGYDIAFRVAQTLRVDDETTIGAVNRTQNFSDSDYYVIENRYNTKIYLKNLSIFDELSQNEKESIIGNDQYIVKNYIRANLNLSIQLFSDTLGNGYTYTSNIDLLGGRLLNTSGDIPSDDGSYEPIPDGSPDLPSNDGTIEEQVIVNPDGSTTIIYIYYPQNGVPIQVDSSGQPIVNDNNVVINFPDNITISDGDSPLVIEDDDLSPDGIKDLIENGFGYLDNPDTPDKDDGFISMISDFFSGIHPQFKGLILFGVSTSIGIALIRNILKR